MICTCGHARAVHALHLTGGGYRSGVCWCEDCDCNNFELSTSSDAGGPQLRADRAETTPTPGRAARGSARAHSESTAARVPLFARAADRFRKSGAARPTTPAPWPTTGGSPR